LITLYLEGVLEEFGAMSVASVDTRTDALLWLALNVADIANRPLTMSADSRIGTCCGLLQRSLDPRTRREQRLSAAAPAR
jgi:hypothetical protein